MRLFNIIEMNQQGRPPVNNPLLPKPDAPNITMASVFKPFKFGNIMTINRNWLIRESTFKLNQISRLEKNLRSQLNNPNLKDKRKIEINARFCQEAYKIHHEYTSKLIFWKSRSMLLRGPQIRQLFEQYSRFLFMLNQNYQRQCLGIQAVKTSNY